jgi:hypothetical protein
MPRAGNRVRTKTVKLSTTPVVYENLLLLARTGLFGKNPSEVAEELLRGTLRERIREGWTEPDHSRRGKPG